MRTRRGIHARTALAGALLCAALAGCSSDGAPEGGPKGGRGGPLRVEGYVAKAVPSETEYRAMGSLRASEEVELRAEASGRIVSLPARDGREVAKGALVAKLDDSELRAQLKAARAKLELARADRARDSLLRANGSLTEAEYDASSASLRSAEAAAELIEAQIAKTEIRAPFAGALGLVDLSVGARVSAGDRVASLSAVKKLRLEFSLPQRHGASLKPGATVVAADLDRGRSARAKVVALDPVLSPESRVRKVRAEVDNRDGSLLAGGFVEVTVPLAAGGPGAIPVPAEAFTLDNEGAYLFLARGGKAETRRVKTGLRTPISVEVVEGLDEGDTVVVSGTINLRQGAAIEISAVRAPLREAR